MISIKWSKNGIDIKADHRHRMSFSDSMASLEVVDCTVKDSGDYVCVASSDAGSDRCSSTVTLKGWFSVLDLRPLSSPLSLPVI